MVGSGDGGYPERARKLLEQVGLGDRLDHRPAELSGGEKQRVALARALIRKPLLLLCDEPTGNLDSRTGQTVLDLIRRLNRERHLTIILVTHSAYAATFGDRTIELRDGKPALGLVQPLQQGGDAFVGGGFRHDT